MQIGISLSMHVQQQLSFKLSQTLQQQMIIAITNLRSKGGFNEESTYDLVIDEAIRLFTPASLHEALQTICKDEKFRKIALANRLDLSKADPNALSSIVVRYLFATTQGEVNYTANDKREHHKIAQAIFVDAFLNPQKIHDEISNIESIQKTNPENASSEGIRHIAENKAALAVAEKYRETHQVMLHALKALFAVKGPGGKSMLREFFLEAFVLHKFTVLLPHRIARRFVKRFTEIRIRETSWSPRSRDAFLNSVGEFVLVCMGIISPTVFVMKKGRVDTELIEELEEAGFNASEYLKSMNLSPTGCFFWNRWHTLNKRPSYITDDLIRSFITQTVRADSATLLRVVDFEKTFQELKDISRANDLDDDEKEEACAEVMIKTLTDDKFIEVLVERIKSSWMQKLTIFY
jgi:hypothetical protein